MNQTIFYIANGITIFIVTLIILLCLIYRKSPLAKNALPNLVTILGVLGTFIGVCIGLFGFNTANIQESVPTLLEGLKTAFITSIAGMLAAFIMRLISFVKDAKKVEIKKETYGTTADTLAKILSKIQFTQNEIWKQTDTRIQSIEKAIVGDGETTILTQLQKIRTSFNDKQETLIEAFKDFAKTMAEQNSKALIEALKDVIKDFNLKITEQFGDNFKHLNEAVAKLLDWQIEYKSQIEIMTTTFTKTVESISEIKNSISIISEKSESIVSTSEKLEPILNSLNEIQINISEHLKIFAEISDKAKETIPNINEYFEKSIGIFTEKIEDYIDNINDAIEDSMKNFKEASKEIKKSIETNIKSIEKQVTNLETFSENIDENLNNIVTNISKDIEKLISESDRTIKQQIENLDKGLQEELTKSLQTLGSQLATISEKFVEDYTPLTERLRDIIEIAEDIK